jgi:uncharacterized membrane protein
LLKLFRSNSYLSKAENKAIVEAIQASEKLTSGEIRIFIESRNPRANSLDRAKEIFFREKMQQTAQRNGVLIYLAVKDRAVAVWGDEGIHREVGDEFWNQQIEAMLNLFKNNSLSEGICTCVKAVGEVLKNKFPYQEGTDKNELADDIIFGR